MKEPLSVRLNEKRIESLKPHPQFSKNTLIASMKRGLKVTSKFAKLLLIFSFASMKRGLKVVASYL